MTDTLREVDLCDVDLYDEIEELRARRGATLLAHYYQDGEIQELADVTGDSLKLAQAAAEAAGEAIVLCGVYFMAEVAKMLNPHKRVLVPDPLAGCSLVESCPAPALAERQARLRGQGRRFKTVAYFNTSAAVKALADYVVTSSNAERIIPQIDDDCEILFVPDGHFGRYLQEVTGRKFIIWDGACIVHESFSIGDLLRMKRRYRDARTIAHPECPRNVLEQSDFIGSSGAMVRYVERLPDSSDVLVATEINMMRHLKSRFPQHRFHPVPGVTCSCTKCPHMARNTLEKLRDCLANESPEVPWRDEFAQAAEVVRRSLSM